MCDEADALVEAAETCTAACIACARATEAWYGLVDTRCQAFLAKERLDAWSNPWEQQCSPGQCSSSGGDDDDLSSGSTCPSSWSSGSSPRKSVALWTSTSSSSLSSQPFASHDETKWAKFPAAGLVPPTPMAPRSSARLPEGWLELPAPDGWTTIYVNTSLSTTSWTRPEIPRGTAERYVGRVINVQSHYAFVRTDPPIIVNNRDITAHKSAKHAKRIGDIFVYRADVEFDLKARQQVTFELAEYKGRVKAVHVRLDHDAVAIPTC
mmetsp:Transcript_8927/g.22591  ORF Transcript_8927/g.22591 Transcript_8927/m.22591 type:complete len:266 (+) Transcript_8927:115-912(+)|eukprot:CAMPEP_0197429264 /NCGR_PEP_ID=MMETSP1170-20131217/43398_1 /TAXON_ID=54406 /ORGANISM="Sarcinochrysis sp, Strain CCMP770" /LENGTH=265 /DNA_ID=CAMNT_0042957089 /DNA_START=114 /DNA_END=911 /DNA_ORIENTATION=-